MEGTGGNGDPQTVGVGAQGPGGPGTGTGPQSSGKGAGGDGAGGSEAEGGAGGAGASDPVGGGGRGGEGGASCVADLDSSEEHCGRCNRPCVDTNVFPETKCTGGVCVSDCVDGFTNVRRPEENEGDDDGCETAWRRVFVTEDPVRIPIQPDGGQDPGGVAAADIVCAERALDAGRTGEWKAWISAGDGVDAPAQRFVKYQVPYWLYDDTVIGDTFQHLADGAIDAPIVITETGESLLDLDPEVQLYPVWTATDPFGETTANHCENWTDASNPKENLARVGIAGDLGEAGLPPSAWTAAEDTLACNNQNVRLYCFEQ